MGCSLHCHLCCHSLQRPPLHPTMKTCQSRHHYTELYLCHCRHSDSTSTTQSTHVADSSRCFSFHCTVSHFSPCLEVATIGTVVSVLPCYADCVRSKKDPKCHTGEHTWPVQKWQSTGQAVMSKVARRMYSAAPNHLLRPHRC